MQKKDRKNNALNFTIYTLITLLFVTALVLSFVFSSSAIDPTFVNRHFWPTITYGVLFLISIGVIVFYVVYFKNQKNIWAFLILVSISISLVGYFAFTLSNNLSEALLANKISYFGNVFLLLFAIFLISNVLHTKFPRWVTFLLFGLSFLMFIFSTTQGYTDFFYKNASFSINDGYVKIRKEYGIGHTFYLIYIGLYASILIFLLIHSRIKKSKTPSIYITLFSIICLINVLSWFLEMILHQHFEFLTITYVLSEIILMYLYGLLVKNKAFDAYVITLNVNDNNSSRTVNLMVRNQLTHNLESNESLNNDVDLKDLNVELIKELLVNNPQTKDLTSREIDVAVYLLKDLKRKDIARNLFVSEDTVKTHTSHIFQKMHISSREDLKETITKKKK